MAKYPINLYAPFFGDEHADDNRVDTKGRDITLLSVFIKDLADIDRAIYGISIVRNKVDSRLGLTPEQFAARQQILTAARSVLIAERKKRLEEMYSYWSAARGGQTSTTE